MYDAYWTGILRPSWECELYNPHAPEQLLMLLVDTPKQHRYTNCLHSLTRWLLLIGESKSGNDDRFLLPGYRLRLMRQLKSVLQHDHASKWRQSFGVVINKVCDGYESSPRESASITHLVHCHDDIRVAKLPLPSTRYTSSTGAVRSPWCL